MAESMNARIAGKFKISMEDVEVLIAAGLDNPVKIRNAENLPIELSEEGAARIRARQPKG